MWMFTNQENGRVWSWGYGILGKGPKLEKTALPERIPQTLFGDNDFNPGVKVVDIQCGMYHFAALTSKFCTTKRFSSINH